MCYLKDGDLIAGEVETTGERWEAIDCLVQLLCMVRKYSMCTCILHSHNDTSAYFYAKATRVPIPPATSYPLSISLFDCDAHVRADHIQERMSAVLVCAAQLLFDQRV